jgi:structural maintenance of chromosomes protein 5
MRDVRKNLTDLQFDWDAGVIARAEKALQHAETLDTIAQAQQRLIEVQLQLIEANSDVEGLKARNAHIMQRLEEEKQIVREAQEEAALAHEAGLRLSGQVSEMLAAAEEDYRALLTDLSEGKTPEDLQIEVDAEEAKLELIHAANPNVIRDFERRAAEIVKLKHKMEAATSKILGLTAKTEEIMGQFEPKLDALVSQINDAFAYNFEQISCAGEVRVHKDNDFDQWALDIMVRFRYVS